MNDLLRMSKDVFSAIESFDEIALKGLESVDFAWFTYLHIAMTQFDTLDSISMLLEKDRYRDCFVLLRSVFECSFSLMLMMNGKKFRETRLFRIIANKGEDVRSARDKTLEKWKEDRASGDPRYDKVVDLNKESEDVILVTVEDEGLFMESDSKKEGPVIPRYYFAFDEYNPEVAFTTKLPSVSAGNPYPALADEQWRMQKLFYNRFFYFSSLERNLKLNGFLDDEKADRFEVHYSFLSAFVHPTKMGTPRIGERTYSYPYTPPVMRYAMHELILHYICSLQSLLLSTLTGFFEKINRKADFEGHKKQVAALDSATSDFWFIYNNPTRFDKDKSDYLKKAAADLGNPVDPNVILYYGNPLKRMADLLIAQKRVAP